MTDHQKRKFIHSIMREKPQLIRGTEFPGRLELLPGEEPDAAIKALLSLVQPKRRITALGNSILRLPEASTYKSLLVVLNSIFSEAEEPEKSQNYTHSGKAFIEAIPSQLRWKILNGLLKQYQEKIALLNIEEEHNKEKFTPLMNENIEESKEEIQNHIVDSLTKMFVALPNTVREQMIEKFTHVQKRLKKEDDSTS